MKAIIAALGFMAAAAAAPALAEEAKVNLPANYATTFSNYLSLDRTANEDQIIRLFANDIALQGPGADGQLPYGSVIVGEIYKAKKDASGAVIESSLGRRVRGEMATLVVMERQPGWDAGYADDLKTGDWEFAAFGTDGTRKAADLNACHGCHNPLSEQGYLFSYDHLKK